MKNIFFILAFWALLSCNDLLIEKPKSFISPDDFYTNIDESISALYGVYDILPSMYRSQYMVAFADVSANGFVVTSASATDYQPFDINTLSPSNSPLTNFWESSYRGINRANAVIERTDLLEFDQGTKNIIIGEAKFLRGMFYFNLVRLFGDVPLVINETKSLMDLEKPRTSTEEIYDQIISDLIDAESHIPANPIELGRASSYAASALLSKVYLTIGDFGNALANAKQVVEANVYSLWQDYKDAFLEINDNGKESIFAVQFRKDVDGNPLIGWSMPPILNKYVEGSPLYDLMIVSDELQSSYDEGDQRKDLNAVTKYTTAEGEVINFPPFCFKYADGVFTDKGEAYNHAYNSGVNFQILRYADILLILAEAENEVSGPTKLAFDALNKVRRRAYGMDINSPSPIDLAGLTKEEFREVVWKERFKELPMEGSQWFDLIRTNRVEEVLQISTEQTLYPIPQREMDVNSNLVQNPGY